MIGHNTICDSRHKWPLRSRHTGNSGIAARRPYVTGGPGWTGGP